VKLENRCRNNGLGRIGKLPAPMNKEAFLDYVKEKMGVTHIRHSGELNRKIERVAVCGGGGASLIGTAMNAGADAFVTGDIKYHDFYTPDNEMIIADIGHFEGEHFIREIIYNEVKENFTTFAAALSKEERLKIFIS